MFGGNDQSSRICNDAHSACCPPTFRLTQPAKAYKESGVVLERELYDLLLESDPEAEPIVIPARATAVKQLQKLAGIEHSTYDICAHGSQAYTGTLSNETVCQRRRTELVSPRLE